MLWNRLWVMPALACMLCAGCTGHRSREQVRVTTGWLAGVWIQTTPGYDLRFHASGLFEHGRWDGTNRIFTPLPHSGPSPGFTNSFRLEGGPGRIVLGLDGAEETLFIVPEGVDGFRWMGTVPGSVLSRFRRVR